MVLIITTSFNFTIQQICTFLLNNEISFIRFNVDEFILGHSGSISIKNEKVYVNGYDCDEFKDVIVWKSNISLVSKLLLENREGFDSNTLYYKTQELTATFNYVITLLTPKIKFGYYKDDIDKLTQYRVAASLKLNVPNYLVCSDYSELESLTCVDNYIVKPILATFSKKSIKSYCEKLENVDFNTTNYFLKYPFMIQEKIPFDFEVRVLFFNGSFFAGKIVLDNTGQTDYRLNQQYHFERYELETSLQRKLYKFAEEFNLKTAVFDLLFNKDIVYFLESNPTGNFISLIRECSYNITKDLCHVFKRE